jgi:hypothetical protein
MNDIKSKTYEEDDLEIKQSIIAKPNMNNIERDEDINNIINKDDTILSTESNLKTSQSNNNFISIEDSDDSLKEQSSPIDVYFYECNTNIDESVESNIDIVDINIVINEKVEDCRVDSSLKVKSITNPLNPINDDNKDNGKDIDSQNDYTIEDMYSVNTIYIGNDIVNDYHDNCIDSNNDIISDYGADDDDDEVNSPNSIDNIDREIVLDPSSDPGVDCTNLISDVLIERNKVTETNNKDTNNKDTNKCTNKYNNSNFILKDNQLKLVYTKRFHSLLYTEMMNNNEIKPNKANNTKSLKIQVLQGAQPSHTSIFVRHPCVAPRSICYDELTRDFVYYTIGVYLSINISIYLTIYLSLNLADSCPPVIPMIPYYSDGDRTSDKDRTNNNPSSCSRFIHHYAPQLKQFNSKIRKSPSLSYKQYLDRQPCSDINILVKYLSSGSSISPSIRPFFEPLFACLTLYSVTGGGGNGSCVRISGVLSMPL